MLFQTSVVAEVVDSAEVEVEEEDLQEEVEVDFLETEGIAETVTETTEEDRVMTEAETNGWWKLNVYA